MIDIAQLREALNALPEGKIDNWRGPIYDAARELLTIREAGALIITPDEAEKVDWCQVHKSPQADQTACESWWLNTSSYPVGVAGKPPCIFVPALVVLDALRDAMPDGET